ncbi:TIGR03862 family flavoprotein [Chthonobacter rhizosphaerae]|uniref:TIGR03862 family flavoprotein n=1 Tax=Chthonobacter rhizosphaerae TaxID=2735553 RepID=UPI0015EE918C|nr:TIGR03862 family flavoprotein [Chthonobacter rhizosphaerae]
MPSFRVAIVGGGPAGLMAAERLTEHGHHVDVYDRMPTVGRKFLLAGKSGLNLTHGQPYADFLARYGDAVPAGLRAGLDAFTPEAVRAWADDLGAETFVGTSGRVFPKAMKASPLLRAWLRRLEARGVRIHVRHRWTGFTADGGLAFETPDGHLAVHPDAVVLALGGASWPRLGSDGTWMAPLAEAGVATVPFQASNSGFQVPWSPPFRERFAGEPVKTVTACVDGRTVPGEFVITDSGIEGGVVYAHAAALRAAIQAGRPAVLTLDLLPGRAADRLVRDLSRPREKQSTATFLRKAAGLDGVKAGLLREVVGADVPRDAAALARLLKALPLRVGAPSPIAEAISTAGGVRFDALTDDLMVAARPGLFIAGEMLDWDAPTGGYLLTACFATGRAAADGVARWLGARSG